MASETCGLEVDESTLIALFGLFDSVSKTFYNVWGLYVASCVGVLSFVMSAAFPRQDLGAAALVAVGFVGLSGVNWTGLDHVVRQRIWIRDTVHSASDSRQATAGGDTDDRAPDAVAVLKGFHMKPHSVGRVAVFYWLFTALVIGSMVYVVSVGNTAQLQARQGIAPGQTSATPGSPSAPSR